MEERHLSQETPSPASVLVSPRETNSTKRQYIQQKWDGNFTYKHKAASRHPANLNAPRREEIKLLVSLFYTLEPRLQMGI